MNPILDSHLEMLRIAIDVSHKRGTEDYRALVQAKVACMWQNMSAQIPATRKQLTITAYQATVALAVVDGKTLSDSEVSDIMTGV